MHLILFDMDGTLVDSQHMIVAAMWRAFDEHRLARPPRDAVLGVVGLSLVEAVSGLLAEPEAVDVEALATSYKAAFMAERTSGLRHEPLFPGARQTLDRLAARNDVVLGIATGKSRRGVAAVIDLHDLHGRFATIQTADDHPSKPHPSMILTALAETGVEPARAVIIGDSSYDMAMARAAGIRALGVSWGYQPADVLALHGPAAILDEYDQVIPAIARLFGWPNGAGAPI